MIFNQASTLLLLAGVGIASAGSCKSKPDHHHPSGGFPVPSSNGSFSAIFGTGSSSYAAPTSPASSSSAVSVAAASTSSASSSAVAMSSVASSSAAPASSSIATSQAAASSSSSSSGTTYKASFTEYGSTDDNGSGNCNVATAACGFYTNPGYSAAVSQNLYGVGPGAGAGPACGECWKLTAETDSSGNSLSNAGNSIVIMVNNLCPADSNPLCSQSGMSGTNQYGANVNFDLCIDSGASSALFGSSGVGLAVGNATQVDCSQWSGTEQT